MKMIYFIPTENIAAERILFETLIFGINALLNNIKIRFLPSWVPKYPLNSF